MRDFFARTLQKRWHNPFCLTSFATKTTTTSWSGWHAEFHFPFPPQTASSSSSCCCFSPSTTTQPHLWWSWALGPAFRAHIICIISEQAHSPLPCVSKREAWNRYAYTLSTVFEEIRRELNCLFFVLSWPFISRGSPAILNMQKYAVSIHYWQCDLDFFFHVRFNPNPRGHLLVGVAFSYNNALFN